MTLEQWQIWKEKWIDEYDSNTQRVIEAIFDDWKNQVTLLQILVDRQAGYIDGVNNKIETLKRLFH